MVDSLISEDLKIEGDLNAKDGKVIVAGQVTGNIKAGSVEVRGSVNGAIDAATVFIQGKQVGKVSCSELSLTANADVQSDVAAKSMTSEKGARLRGRVEISGA